MTISEAIFTYTNKKLERTLLIIMAIIVVAKIVLQLALPDSSPEALWKHEHPNQNVTNVAARQHNHL